ncbi:hypothetical protein HME9304_03166 [Flagellimonas maritima]|uniref:Cupin domain-containing protein n=2 Tax=Flagellimonas maritima TaxID=1383885 RepID=A0A2Z4LX92_9FLAO|nr:hypothetical protein HME9304_03166 [Allomuricauda aurantiaca]
MHLIKFCSYGFFRINTAYFQFDVHYVQKKAKYLLSYWYSKFCSPLTKSIFNMKISKEDIPVTMQSPDTIMRALPNYGGMTVCFNELPKGTDFTPLLKGLENNSCHCPHWGYVLEGSIRCIYDDGSEETVEAGDVFYWPSGHTAIVKDDVKMIDFSPTKEFNEVIAHVGKMMAESS